MGLGRPVELDGPEEVSVVGDGQGRHLEGVGPLEERFNPDRPVEKAVLGVEVKVDKIGVGHEALPQGARQQPSSLG